MDDKPSAQQLMQAMARMRSDFRVLRKELERQDDVRLLRRWGQRWERERREQRLRDARN